MSVKPTNLSSDLETISPWLRSLICSALAVLSGYVVLNGGLWCINVMRGNMNTPAQYLVALAVMMPMNWAMVAAKKKYWVVVALFSILLFFVILTFGGGISDLQRKFPQSIYYFTNPSLTLIANAVFLKMFRRVAGLNEIVAAGK